MSKWRSCGFSSYLRLYHANLVVDPRHSESWLVPDKISTKSCRAFIRLWHDDHAPKHPLERDCRRCCALVFFVAYCVAHVLKVIALERAFPCGYRSLGSRVLRHIGFAAGDRCRLFNLETFSQYEADSCSSDIPSRYICNCGHPGLLGSCRISSGDFSCFCIAWAVQVGSNCRNLDRLGHRHSCVICSCSSSKRRDSSHHLTQHRHCTHLALDGHLSVTTLVTTVTSPKADCAGPIEGDRSQ